MIYPRRRVKKEVLKNFYRSGYIATDIHQMLYGRLYVYSYKKKAYGAGKLPALTPLHDNIITRIDVDHCRTFIDLYISTDGVASINGRVSMSIVRKSTSLDRIGLALLGQPFRFVCCRQNLNYKIDDEAVIESIPILQEQFKYYPSNGGKPIIRSSDFCTVEKY